MKLVTKYSLCTLVSIGLACTTHAKQDEEKKQKDKQKPDKVEAVENHGLGKSKREERYKKEKVLIVDEHSPCGAPDRPFSVPDTGSTVALLGLSLAAVGLAHRRLKTWSA